MWQRRKLWLLAAGAVAVELAAWYATMGKSRRRYFGNIVRQIPDLPGRYAV